MICITTIWRKFPSERVAKVKFRQLIAFTSIVPKNCSTKKNAESPDGAVNALHHYVFQPASSIFMQKSSHITEIMFFSTFCPCKSAVNV
jgi:hypothetical protein